jgi:hypothetical protein
MINERRTDERAPLRFVTRWEGPEDARSGHVRNLSSFGCFVESAGRVEVGERVTLLLQVRAGGGQLKLVGEVIHCQPNGFGLRFANLTTLESSVIAQLVLNLGGRLL